MKLEIVSPLPAHTLLQRIRERAEGTHASTAGRVEGTVFRLTVRPLGRPPYVAVGRGEVIADGSHTANLRGSVRPTLSACVLVAAGVALALGGAVQLFRWFSGDLSGADPAITRESALGVLGLTLAGLLVVLSLVPRYFDEAAALRRALRDAAGANEVARAC